MFDEVALVAVERANRIFSEQQKKEKEDAKRDKAMSEFFADEDDLWE